MTKKQSLNIFIAPLNWGLGHATRDLPLIKEFLKDGHKVFIAANERSKMLLEREAPDCIFVTFPVYPIRYSKTRLFVLRFMLITYPNMLIAMIKEKKALKKLHKKHGFDLIISDNRFNVSLKDVRSYLISHQLRYKLHFPLKYIEGLPEYFNSLFFNRYDKIIVPDTEEDETLTDKTSHDMLFIKKEKLYYSGILTDVIQKPDIEQDIDYFIIVSGPEPQRTKLEKIIYMQVNQLSGKVVVALGKPEKNYKVTQGNAVFYTHFNRDKMNEYMQRAKFIISRPGYTTVMEMAQLGKKGLLIPTPGQVEQEYLADHYMKNNWAYSVPQHKLNLKEDIQIAHKYQGFPDSFANALQNAQKLVKLLTENK